MTNQSPRYDVVTWYQDAPTSTVSAAGVSFVYRELGPRGGVPRVFLHHQQFVPKALEFLEA